VVDFLKAYGADMRDLSRTRTQHIRTALGRIVLAVQFVLSLTTGVVSVRAEEGEQDAETKALDSTASQWSFQVAYQAMPDYYSDTLDNGETRRAGADNYAQLRIVAPLPLSKLTILPRMTIRHYENSNGDSGFGNTELFALIIPRSWDWGMGRAGIGPLVTLPGDEKVARDEWAMVSPEQW